MPACKKVCYIHEADVGLYEYGQSHPMKPYRVAVTNSIVKQWGLHQKMDILQPRYATAADMKKYHLEDYIDFIHSIGPCAKDACRREGFSRELTKYNFGDDCPVFDGLWELCQLCAGGSLAAARHLNAGKAEVAINWAGGLHHARKSECRGFCYVNDIVLAILELLQVFPRVLYVDIDIHHGDGVEEAFYLTDRVMTVSFHKFGDFFPGTGDITDIGVHKGKGFAVNFPLKDGINDASYQSIFEPVMTRVLDSFQPSAIVMQCGADSLAGDMLGTFNLTLKGHAKCLQFLRKHNVPMLVLGGGGYTVKNVARCWSYETAVLCGEEVPNELPTGEFPTTVYASGEKLHLPPKDVPDTNTREELERHVMQICENIRQLQGPPSVQMHETGRFH
eukprot:GGOE01061679.1.p1 GENE.GGOE01061679.1~~GGOE01061679.1.p1  ORF type:complete len:391 (+),score=92.62 GGOE01061679.1:149-1321(+)